MAKNTIRIHINKEHFDIEVPITGEQLRELGAIPPENQLFEERHGQEPDNLIEAGTSYSPEHGTHFYDLPRGTVGAVADQLAHAAKRLLEGRVEPQDDGTSILRWRTTLPEAWFPREVELLVVVPPAYPAQAPSGFDAFGQVMQNGALPAGTGGRTLGQQDCLHFCWNASGQIDYTAPDGLWRFAKFSESRFLA